MTKRAAEPGETMSYRGDGSSLVFDYTDSKGLEMGHIVRSDGLSGRQLPLVSILAHGYWTAEPDG